MNANMLIGIAGTPSVSPRASLVSCCLPASEGLGFAGHGEGCSEMSPLSRWHA